MTHALRSLGSRFDPVGLAVAPFAALIALTFGVLAAKDGGFAPTVWLPAALFTALLLAVALWNTGLPPFGASTIALCALGAFVVVLACSVAWASVRGDAWLGADRGLFYLLLFTLCFVLPWRHGLAVLALGGFGSAVAAVGLWQFLRIANDPVGHRDFFVAGRLATPVSYPNANCALLVMAALPLLVLASRREVPLLARGLFLAGAGIAGELAVACQSRLSVLAVPLVLLLLLCMIGGRVRLIFTAAPVVAAIALSGPTILHLYDALFAGVGADALADARRAILISGVALLILGWAGAAFDQRVALPPQARIAAVVAAVLVVAAAVVVGVVAVHRVVPHPVAFVHAQWRAFITGGDYSNQNHAHFTSTGTNRYEVWRVAGREFADSPVGGVGADNFAADYLRERRKASEDPLFPHSLPLMIASQTGALGSIAFLAFLAAVGVAMARSVGRAGPKPLLL